MLLPPSSQHNSNLLVCDSPMSVCRIPKKSTGGCNSRIAGYTLFMGRLSYPFFSFSVIFYSIIHLCSDDLSHLEYTAWCIKESLRLYPPVHFFGRVLSEDTEIDGYLIPKGYCFYDMCCTELLYHVYRCWSGYQCVWNTS